MSAAPRSKRARRAKRTGVAVKPAAPPWWLAAVGAVALLALTLWAWPPRPAPEPHVERGSALYGQGRYRDALGEYENAPGNGPRNAGVQLDRGLARFRVAAPPPDAGGLPRIDPDAGTAAGVTQAQEEFRTAARGGTTGAAEDVDAALRARGAYDLGNTFFAQRAWDNAIDAYKEALRLRPGWSEAAWNLELARREREAERNPPDAGQPDAGQPDASPPDAGDSGDAGPPPDAAAGDGGGHGDGGGQGDSGRGDGGGNRGDSGAQGGPDGGAPPDAGGAGSPDAAAPPPPPRSMAPLDDLDRSSRSLQNEMMRRRGLTPRSPDDDR